MSTAEQVDVSGFVDQVGEETLPRTVGPSVQPRTLSDIQAENDSRRSSIPSEFLGVEPAHDGSTTFAQAPFWQDFEKRVKQNQDILILVSDYDNDRGTGKTALSIDLGEQMDQTDVGLTPEKAGISPEQLINAYANQARRSALILDEAESGIGKRDAMTKVNKLMNKIVSMARVEEKYVVMNMPASNQIDKGILDLAHYWILVRRRGLARVYDLRNNPFEQRKYPTPVQDLQWSDIAASHPVYEALTKEKNARLDDPSGHGGTAAYLEQADVQEMIEKAEREADKERRDEMIWRMLNHPKLQAAGVSQGTIADIARMSQSHVSTVKANREAQTVDSAALSTD